jgi:hypothetical protein
MHSARELQCSVLLILKDTQAQCQHYYGTSLLRPHMTQLLQAQNQKAGQAKNKTHHGRDERNQPPLLLCTLLRAPTTTAQSAAAAAAAAVRQCSEYEENRTLACVLSVCVYTLCVWWALVCLFMCE